MHVTIWSTHCEPFNSTFEEGKVYDIEEFTVKNHKEGAFRCIEGTKQITLIPATKVKEDETDDGVIGGQVFDLIDIKKIPDMFNNPNTKLLLIGK